MAGAREPFWDRVREVSDVLVYSFDFEVFARPLGVEAYATEAPWLPAFVVPDAAVSVVARNAIGAVYAWCERGPAKCCLHIDARGTASRIGDDLRQMLALVVALPYWPELLAQCPHGGPTAREVARRLEQEACDDLYELPAARRELQTFLELPDLGEPLRRLYEQASQPPPVTVWSPHGWRYESASMASASRETSP